MPKTGTSIGQFFLNQMAESGLINYYPSLSSPSYSRYAIAGGASTASRGDLRKSR